MTLNDNLSQDQKDLIDTYELGGLLKISATSLPLDYSKWILQHVDPIKSCIVVEGQGEIMLNPDGVTEVLELPNIGGEVFYGMDQKATEFKSNLYGLGSAPEITAFCKMIEDMNGKADDNFMRAWIVLIVTCYLCPTTSLCVSPRCYPMVVDLKKAKRLNFAKFVHDQIMTAVSNMGTKKKSVTCCVHHLVVKYVDSRFFCPKLQSPGESSCSLFVGYEETERFVSSKLPSDYSPSKKRKLTAMASDLCRSISDQVGNFIKGVGKLHGQAAVDRPTKKVKHVTFAVPSGVSTVRDTARNGVKRRGNHSEDDDDDFVAPARQSSKQADDSFKAHAHTLPKPNRNKLIGKDAPSCAKTRQLHINDTIKGDQTAHTKKVKEGLSEEKPVEFKGKIQSDQAMFNQGPTYIGNLETETVHDVAPLCSLKPEPYQVQSFANLQANEGKKEDASCKDSVEATNQVQQASDTATHPTRVSKPKTPTPNSVSSLGAVPLQSELHESNQSFSSTIILSGNRAEATNRAEHAQVSSYHTDFEANQEISYTAKTTTSTSLCSDPLAAVTNTPVPIPGTTKHSASLLPTQTGASVLAQDSKSQSPTTPAPEQLVHQQIEKAGSCLRRSPRKTGLRVNVESASINLNLPPRVSKGTATVPIEIEDSVDDDEEWDPKVLSQAEAGAKRVISQLRNLQLDNDHGDKTKAHILNTPTSVAAAAIDVIGSSSSINQPLGGHERRAVQAVIRPPYVDPANMDPFFCSKDVNSVYTSVCQNIRRTSRSKTTTTCKPIINYDEFFISKEELAASMGPECKVESCVAEIGIAALRTTDKRPKRHFMPLRITTFFQNGSFIRTEIDKWFNNFTKRLSTCESVQFPVLEILDKSAPKESGHYYTSKIQIRDFPIIEINCHKQTNGTDCGIYMLQNVGFTDRTVPQFGQENVPSIRKLMVHKWLSCDHNDVNWRAILNVKKDHHYHHFQFVNPHLQ
ncbi:unnamed protein product [Alopecurus aequalis]